MAFLCRAMPHRSTLSVRTSIIQMMRVVRHGMIRRLLSSRPRVIGEYKGTASAEGYCVDRGALNLSSKEQKWLGSKDISRWDF